MPYENSDCMEERRNTEHEPCEVEDFQAPTRELPQLPCSMLPATNPEPAAGLEHATSDEFDIEEVVDSRAMENMGTLEEGHTSTETNEDQVGGQLLLPLLSLLDDLRLENCQEGEEIRAELGDSGEEAPDIQVDETIVASISKLVDSQEGCDDRAVPNSLPYEELLTGKPSVVALPTHILRRTLSKAATQQHVLSSHLPTLQMRVHECPG
ncbi:unnamed protein product [Protopolystoma xenopodis]|uniref:Uncharacterized protein n=1 Tax=Protopolystoma xenopodis TaxID=117903 RepID=A0A3S5BNS3_9PLAT|nr:unnamed protein product [Protopolystoma xenopodis]